MSETEYKPVFVGQPKPTPHKSTVWDWLMYYAYNLVRRPLVRKRQAEVRRIFKAIKSDVDYLLLPKLWSRTACPDCAKAIVILTNQVYTSMIERFLRASPCAEHPEVYTDFYFDHLELFKRSESLAAWINGFK